MEKNKELNALLQKYHDELCTAEERMRIEVWLDSIANQREGTLPSPDTVDRILTNIKQDNRYQEPSLPKKTKTKIFTRRTIQWAACLIGTVVTAGLVYYATYIGPQSDQVDAAQAFIMDDISPGTERATLTLSDGKTVPLENQYTNKANAILETATLHHGRLSYDKDRYDEGQTTSFHTLTTPRGGQYQLRLADGTKVWLNASSSITYPISFSKTERRVSVRGEVYFDVSKDDSKPFVVESHRQKVKVLGTQFNISAYDDDPAITTTLIEGSVEVSHATTQEILILKPGQQAAAEDHLTVHEVNLHTSTAWKDGDFVFDKENLGSVLRKVARWYDVEIECPSNLESITYSGFVSRSKPLSAIVKMIQSTNNVKIQLKERRIIVTK